MSNMQANLAASAYRRVSTAVHPAVAVVRLYDSAIVHIQRAVMATEANRLDDAFTEVTRAATVLRGLSHTLNFDRGGAVAEQLSRTYSANIMALFRSLGRADATDRYRRISDGLGSLRDAWAALAGMPTRAQDRAPKPPQP